MGERRHAAKDDGQESNRGRCYQDFDLMVRAGAPWGTPFGAFLITCQERREHGVQPTQLIPHLTGMSSEKYFQIFALLTCKKKKMQQWY